MQTYNHTTIQTYNHTNIQPYKHAFQVQPHNNSTIQTHNQTERQVTIILHNLANYTTTHPRNQTSKNPTTLQQYKPLNCAAIKLTTRQSFDHITIQPYNHTTNTTNTTNTTIQPIQLWNHKFIKRQKQSKEK